MKPIRGKRYDHVHTKMIIEAMDSEYHKNLGLQEKAKREAEKQTPRYIRDEKMRKLLQHNAVFQKNHKSNEPTIEEYEQECKYLADGVYELIKADLEGKEKTFDNMQEIITFYRTNLKFIANYSALISKSKPEVRIAEDLFEKLITLNPYFLCCAPLRCFLKSGLPMDKVDENSIKTHILPRIEKSNLLNNSTFVKNYGKYFNLNITI